jgi:hypothetical protein
VNSKLTIGERVLELRERLCEYPLRDDCGSFAGTERYRLGMSFFPSDLGLYDSERESISTIVLGSDWGNEQSFFSDYLKRTEHKNNQTVKGTDKMLEEAGFDKDDCFYSNAWPVMRSGNSPEQNHHPMRDDLAFTEAYRRYLRLTIAELKPKLVVALGLPVAWFLGPFFGDDWKPGRLSSIEQPRWREKM